ncbi:MAG: tyrosine-protein phosphatase [Phycisphaerales bacterium]
MQANDDQSAAGSRTKKQPKLLRLVVIVVLVAGVIYGIKKTRYQFIARNFGVVEAGEIYRSGRLTPRMFRKTVGENSIKTVLDLGAYQPGSPEDLREQQLAEELGAERYRFQLDGDGTGNPNYYVQALRLMSDPEAQPILIHCAAGAQRTGACVLLYRLIIQGQDLAQAYPESFQYKHNPDNWRLLAYVVQWNDEIADSLRTSEPIPGFEPVEYPLASSARDSD